MTRGPIPADWIAVDWGTSNLRAWALRNGVPCAEAQSADGMGTLTHEGYEPALLRLIEPWLVPGRVTDALACGMVGSRQGWAEAPYATVPCAPHGAFARPAVADPRLRVHIVPGLRQMRPADVMRGEETQIAGLLAHEPRFDGVACLPGTHTKWVHVSAGEVVSFTSFMTGEMFALLSQRSVLHHSIAASGWSEPDFASGIEETLTRPERLGAQLFAIRAAHLIAGADPEAARARLSGLLIGAELAGSRPYWLGREVVVIGEPALAAAYVSALGLCGLTARSLNATAMTLAGLAAAQTQLLSQRSLQ